MSWSEWLSPEICNRRFCTVGSLGKSIVCTHTHVNIPIKIWQSMRSVIPPCPGIESPKSLILNALFTPEAKKPPNGAIKPAKNPSTIELISRFEIEITVFIRGMDRDLNANKSLVSQLGHMNGTSEMSSRGQIICSNWAKK